MPTGFYTKPERIVSYTNLRLVRFYFFLGVPPRFARGRAASGFANAPSGRALRGQTALRAPSASLTQALAPPKILLKEIRLQIGISTPPWTNGRGFYKKTRSYYLCYKRRKKR